MTSRSVQWRISWRVLLLPLALASAGCASLMSNVTQSLASDLSDAILSSEDLELVRDGAPAYLILIDGLVARSPKSAPLLAQAAQLNSAYATAFIDEPARARLMHGKARSFAFAAACHGLRNACDLATRPYPDYERWLDDLSENDVPLLYGLAGSWAGWIQAHSDDFNAIAELGRVKALVTRVAELAPSYDNGGAYLYLGVFETLVPPALGGRPEIGRAHFERAIELSGGRHLLAKVMFADQYARMVFDRELHDTLLNDVLEAPVEAPGLTLINVVAKQQAKDLLESADDYF